MPKSDPNRARNMITGALVADAATMGLHWVYDQDHIRTLAPDAPEFRTPQAQDYAGVPGYFAHGGRESGAQSQYGEQVLVMLRSLISTDGVFEPRHFQSSFSAHFGYGGSYVGYIDHATRETLDNLRRAEDSAMAEARKIPFDGDPGVTTTMVVKALSLLKQGDPDTLRDRFTEAVRITHKEEATLDYGLQVLDAIVAAPPARGAKDVQLPAIAKLPGLVAKLADASDAEFEQQTQLAIRLTNDHDTAVAYGRVAAHMMRAAVRGGQSGDVIVAGRAVAEPQIEADIAKALAMSDKSVEEVTRHFGMACDLSYAIPSVIFNVQTAANYKEAVTRNIYAGGDNCGRSILVGAVMGAVFGTDEGAGIPSNWGKKPPR